MRLIIVLIVAFLSPTDSTAQSSVVDENIILFDSLSAEELKDRGLISDVVYHNGSVLYLEYVKDNMKKQFYKSNDSTYYYRSFYRGDLYEKGQFGLDSIHFGKIDTVYISCPYDTVILRKKFNLLRKGKWIKTTPGDEKYFGNYYRGEKHGTWSKRNFKGTRSEISYRNGEIIYLTKPYSYESKQFLAQLSDKKMYLILEGDISNSKTLTIQTEKPTSLPKLANAYNVEFGSEYNIEVTPLHSGSDHDTIKGNYSYFRNGYTFEILDDKLFFEISEIGIEQLILKRNN